MAGPVLIEQKPPRAVGPGPPVTSRARRPDDALTDAVDEPAGHIRYVHSPVFAARLIVAAVALVGLAVIPDVFDLAVIGLRGDLTELVNRAPASVPGFVDAVTLVVGGSVVVGSLAAVAVRRDWRGSVRVAVTGLAAAATVLTFERWEGTQSDTRLVLVLIAISTAAALLAAQTSIRHEGLRRIGWVAVFTVALAGAPWDAVGVPGRLETVAAGVVVGAALALIIGTETEAAGVGSLRTALRAAGIPALEIDRHGGDARGSMPWVVELETGSRLFVKTYSAEERSADLLFRAWRFVGLRVPDRRPASSLRAAVEHEAFLTTRAGLVGVRSPRFIATGPIGEDGRFAAYSDVSGSTFDDVAGDLDETTMRATWSMVVTMHRAGIAHRDLRTANLMVDEHGEPWIVDFAFGEMAATEEQKRLDVVELLASLTALVGSRRSVDSAMAVLGPEVLEDALPYVQPLAVSAATRQHLDKAEFAELRETVRAATGAPEPDLPPLATIRPKTVLSVIAFGVAVWVLLSQLGNTGDLVARLSEASWTWIVVAVAASAATYVGAALSIIGSVPSAVPFVPAFASQLASSFVNRVTPAQIGGAVLNIRWLTKEGNDAATATTAVGVNALSGVVVHVTLIAIAIVWAGTGNLSGVQLPNALSFGVVAAVLLVILAAGWALPPLRHTFKRKVRPRLRQSWLAVTALSRQPHKVALAFGGSVLVTFSYLAALTAALHAFGAAPAVSTIAVVFLAGSALASAAPTPSGLGATEAILAAGFIAAGVDQPVAVASVLLFRAATFWLPILPGWIAFVALQHTGRV
jgi:undecaprenyl-diphosphatase